jgi:uncharacterized protein (TIGR02646 family)
MIRIDRSREPQPETLRNKGAAKRRAHERALAKPLPAGASAPPLKFDAKVYGAQDVKQALSRTQHGKCAFCESPIEHISFGDVEHFRPKAGWKQADGDALTKPGYWWLAYEWDNLVLACTLCNQRHKANLFPVRGRRAAGPADSLDAEQPDLIHPGQEDPSGEIVFNGADVDMRRSGARGRATATALGLNRSRLFEQRKKIHDAIKKEHHLIAVAIAFGASSHEAIEEAWADLRRHVEPDQPYSAMAMATLRGLFPSPLKDR